VDNKCPRKIENVPIDLQQINAPAAAAEKKIEEKVGEDYLDVD
jgi:hypothetical protein